jgi:hypothetical protein
MLSNPKFDLVSRVFLPTWRETGGHHWGKKMTEGGISYYTFRAQAARKIFRTWQVKRASVEIIGSEGRDRTADLGVMKSK